MRFALFLTVLAFVGFGLGCSDKPTTPAPAKPESTTPRTIQQLAQEEPELFRAVNAFSLDLFSRVVAEQGESKNVFISPLSVACAVAICYNGANGDTKTEIGRALQLGSFTDDQINRFFRDLMTNLPLVDQAAMLEIANSVWNDDLITLRTDYVQLVQESYAAKAGRLDFCNESSADIVNGWVDSTTHGCIKEIIDKDKLCEAVALILNAIYFKGSWTISFDTARTDYRPFHLSGGSSVDRLMMMSDTSYEYLESDLVRIARLPYGNGSYSMVVLVPGGEHTADELVSALTLAQWDQWLGSLVMTDSVHIGLPELKLEEKYPLNSVLKAMGMNLAFTESADLSRMVDGGGVMISEVFQKTFLRVDEVGTEAAAVTAVVIVPTCIGPPPAVVANRPFVLAICEKTTGAILFLGRVADPVW